MAGHFLVGSFCVFLPTRPSFPGAWPRWRAGLAPSLSAPPKPSTKPQSPRFGPNIPRRGVPPAGRPNGRTLRDIRGVERGECWMEERMRNDRTNSKLQRCHPRACHPGGVVEEGV